MGCVQVTVASPEQLPMSLVPTTVSEGRDSDDETHEKPVTKSSTLSANVIVKNHHVVTDPDDTQDDMLQENNQNNNTKKQKKINKHDTNIAKKVNKTVDHDHKQEEHKAVEDSAPHETENVEIKLRRQLSNSYLAIKKDKSLKNRAKEVLSYWYPETFEDTMSLWFSKSPSIDDEIRRKFGDLVEDANIGLLDDWLNDVWSTMALLCLLDQFPRNIFRHSQKMYFSDKKAQSVVCFALYNDYHRKISPLHCVSLCLVLTHAEDLILQSLCLSVWKDISCWLPKNAPLSMFDGIFKKHYDVIKKFGRFPHRNEIFGRKNTSSEIEFLNDKSFRFDLPLKKNAKTGGYHFKQTTSFAMAINHDDILPNLPKNNNNNTNNNNTNNTNPQLTKNPMSISEEHEIKDFGDIDSHGQKKTNLSGAPKLIVTTSDIEMNSSKNNVNVNGLGNISMPVTVSGVSASPVTDDEGGDEEDESVITVLEKQISQSTTMVTSIMLKNRATLGISANSVTSALENSNEPSQSAAI